MTALPPATLANILPPNRDHCFFEDHDRHPFDPRPSRFSRLNAWWLAEASLLAYDDPEHAIPSFGRAGFDAAASGQAAGCVRYYVATTEETVIVAFRGTRVLKWDIEPKITDAVRGVIEDVCIDANCIGSSWAGHGIVHRGFQSAWQSLSQDLESTLRELTDTKPRRSVWFTGHSLGGALATLAASQWPHAAGLCTFGSPAVGDEMFASHFCVPAFRFVHGHDVVPRLPPQLPTGVAGAYRHVGRLKYLCHEGRLHAEFPPATSIVDRIVGQVMHTRETLARLWQGELGLLPGDAFLDHTPLYYALRLKALREHVT